MMERYGLGLLPYFPLASGLLTGKHKRGAARGRHAARDADVRSDVHDRCEFRQGRKARGLRDRRAATRMLELAFSWLAARPTVGSIIAGATRPEQIDANVKAAGWTLSAEEMAEIDKITAG